MRAAVSLVVLVSAATCGILPAAEWKPAAVPLVTRWGRELTPENAWREYPRPQLVRPDWQSLNGLWQYRIAPQPSAAAGPPDAARATPPEAWDGDILVPFAVESALSGVGRGLAKEQLLWYRRSFTVPPAWRGRRVLLRFEAVDWQATTLVNGSVVGTHRGGSDPFAYDVTDLLRDGDNELVVRVWDPTDDGPQPRGKQKLRPEGIWYTPVSGIWQSVWLEPVPDHRIERIVPRADLDADAVDLDVTLGGAAASDLRLRVRSDDATRRILAEGPADVPLRVVLPEPRRWTPDDPHLHPLVVELVAADGRLLDGVSTYAALRTIAVGPDDAGVPRLLLNGTALFQIGPLDQGWWPDGLLTPPSDEAMRYDLEVLKSLGMNMLRKHIKVEPARYYHHCDRLGLLVWQDMPSGMGAGRDQFVQPDAPRDGSFTPAEKEQFLTELEALITHLECFPSIVVWVPFNEGWGQHDTNEVLRWVKRRDPTRLVNGPSGWTDRGFGDMKDMHMYPGPGMFPVMPDRASVLGEFGGLGLPLEGHLWKANDNWGYRTFRTTADLRAGYGQLMHRLHRLVGRGLAAAVYTQTTDVEVEVNGLLTYDREVLKLDRDETRGWHARLFTPPPVVREFVPTAEAAPVSWRYLVDAPPAGWERPEFDDSVWREGAAGFGTRGTPGAMDRTEWRSPDIWLRRTVVLDALPTGPILLRIHHDEDAEIFVNGVLAATVTGYTTEYVDVPLTAAGRAAFRAGDNLIAVHCHQTGGGQYVDLGFVEEVPAAAAK